ncbi:hypothetical protein LAZ67_10001251 [Cordylochernes scorpioides]|uniref:Uncharacterized protein n=1 Tax=Cordylochernes scorpioides TaxID=51811 RepID=A0ABY6KZH6_9ARAC|nr:hypothetical protein LAZ67_10001251 [Cordylochernes scorpioides]
MASLRTAAVLAVVPRRFSPLACVKIPKDSATVAPAESPGGTLRMPERLGSKCGASAENSAKEALAIDTSEINEKTAGYANLPASNNHANPAAARDITASMSSTGANQAPSSWAETMEVENSL